MKVRRDMRTAHIRRCGMGNGREPHPIACVTRDMRSVPHKMFSPSSRWRGGLE